MKLITMMAAGMGLLLAACVETAPGTVADAPSTAGPTCGATGLQGLIGKPQSALDGMRFAGPVRVIKPGMAVTMDFSPGRLNILLDETGRISRITCG